MKNRLKKYAILMIAKSEATRLFKSRWLLFMSLLFPLVLYLIIGLIYQNKVVTDVPIAIVDLDNSTLSKSITRGLEVTRSLKITDYLHSVEEVKLQMLRGKIEGAIYFYPGLEADLKKGRATRIVVYKNTANLVVGNVIAKEAQTVIKTYSVGVGQKKLQSQGMSRERALNLITPIKIDTSVLFNPSYNYSNYLIAGALPMIWQMVILVLSVIAINSEYKSQNFMNLMKRAEYSVIKLLIGKSLPHLALHIFGGIFLLGIWFQILDIPFQINLSSVLFMLLFIVSSFYFGLAISCVISDPMMATEFMITITAPAFIFSGYTFPLWAMPWLHSTFGSILPFTHFLSGFTKIYQMDLPLYRLQSEITVLLGYFTISFIICVVALKFKKRRLMKGLVHEE